METLKIKKVTNEEDLELKDYDIVYWEGKAGMYRQIYTVLHKPGLNPDTIAAIVNELSTVFGYTHNQVSETKMYLEVYVD